MNKPTRFLTYVDPDGRKWLTQIPFEAPDSDAENGIIVGPPDLEELGLPLDIEVRLHNALFDRMLITKVDAQRKPMEVLSAVTSAFKVTAQAIQALYV